MAAPVTTPVSASTEVKKEVSPASKDGPEAKKRKIDTSSDSKEEKKADSKEEKSTAAKTEEKKAPEPKPKEEEKMKIEEVKVAPRPPAPR